jgi:magnesium transporter
VLRVWFKEVLLGFINGLVLGLLLAFVGWLWKGNLYLGLVAGTALAINNVVAVTLGGTLPLLLKRLKLDPALGAGLILTSLTDLCGFFLVLSIAEAMLPRLVGS